MIYKLWKGVIFGREFVCQSFIQSVRLSVILSTESQWVLLSTNQSIYQSVFWSVSQSEGSKTIGHFRVPKTHTLKTRPSAKPRISCGNEFYLHDNKKSFTQERFCSWLHFKTEACSILKMAYCESMNPWVN